MNQGAEAGGNPDDPKIGLAVNGRIQNQNLAGTGYDGGWIGNRTTNPGHVQHQMVVAGEVLARYGDAADKSAGAGTAPAFAPVAELYLSAPGSALHEGNADPVAHTVVQGETLQSIARSTLGDSRLWYRIAQANGLSVQPDAPLQAGVTLSIPKATLSANSASTFKPYDPSRVIGDANPALSALPVPQADDGCGGFGEILKLAVIIAVTILTEGATASWAAEAGFAEIGAETATIASVDAAELAASVASGAVSYGAGALAGEVFGVATGMQNSIDWRNVGLAAISGGISGGLSGVSALSGNVVLRAAVASALTQGVAVATGLQKSFSWQSVAASAIGAGVGESVGRELSGMDIDPFTGRVLTSAAASTATALARGGRVSITQIGVNAFGQSIGSSLAEQAMMGGTQEDRLAQLYSNDGDIGRSELRFNPNAPNYNFATTDGLDSGFAGTFGTALPRDSSNDVMVADARDKLRLNVVSDSDENFYSNIIGRHQASEARRQAARAASLNSLQSQAREQVNALSAQAATERALNNLTGLADAYRASGMTGSTGDADVFPGYASTDLQASSISESPGLLSNLSNIGQAYANGRVGFGDAISIVNGQIGGIGNVARDVVTGTANAAIGVAEFGVNLIFAGTTPGELGALNFPKFGYTGRTGSLGPDVALLSSMVAGTRSSNKSAGSVRFEPLPISGRGLGETFNPPAIASTQTRTVTFGNGDAIYILDNATALPLQANGRITGPHPGRGKGYLPEPVGGRSIGEQRGHLIPEGGVNNPFSVNNRFNLISEAPSSNLGLKRSLDLQASRLAAENPNSTIRLIAQPIRELNQPRPFAVSYYLTQDGRLVSSLSILNK